MIDFTCHTCNKRNHYEEFYTRKDTYNGFICWNCKAENIIRPNKYATYLNTRTYSDEQADIIKKIGRDNVLTVVSHMVEHGRLSNFEMEKIKRIITDYQKSLDKM